MDYLGWIIVALDNCCNGDLGSVIGHVAGLGAAMRGTMDGDVAAERRLNAIKDLLEVLPRSRGFRVSLDGNVSVYPATQRAWRSPAAKQDTSSPPQPHGPTLHPIFRWFFPLFCGLYHCR